MSFIKNNKVIIGVCSIAAAIAVLLMGDYLFFRDNHKLLAVTEECLVAYANAGIYVSHGEQEVSLGEIEYAIKRNMDITKGKENEYHKKYNTLIKNKKEFYKLTDEECYELYFSGGTSEDVELAKNQILEKGKSIQFRSEGDSLRVSFIDNADELTPPPIR